MRSVNARSLGLLILPLIYLLFTGIFFFPWRPFYTIGPDRVYIYLFNGTTMASGKLSIFYIDNPGIPVQCFWGIGIWFKHLFNHSIPLYQDVLLHPESYMYFLCVAGAFIFFLITWTTGYYIFKRTNNLALSILFQLTPMLDSHGIISTGAPSPELFYLLSGMFFIAYIYCNTISPRSQPQNKVKLSQILVYGAFTAFFISCKYICFPLVFLVLFVLPTLRSRIQYVFSLLVFLFIFMCPALPAWRNIEQWIINLATHTGHYGLGDKGFVNASEYVPNLIKIFKEDIYFTLLYVVLIISICIAIVKRKYANERDKAYSRLLYGVGISSALLILLVAKHYSFHYLIPVRLCYPLIIVGSYHVFKDRVKLRILEKPMLATVLFYCSFVYITYIHVKLFLDFPPKPAPRATADFLQKYKDVPIIMAADFESSRIEPSLYLGSAYTGDYRNHYWEFLKKAYSGYYQYNSAESKIMHWDEMIYAPEVYSSYSKVILYCKAKDSADRTSIIHNATMWQNDTIAHVKLVFRSKESEEYVYELDGNQTLAKALMANPKEVHFDLDKLTSNKSKFISIEGKDTASGIDLLSTQEHHSGNNSILMNWDNQYGLNCNIRAYPGNIVVASIWRKASDGKGCIVLSSKTDGDFYVSGQTAVDSDANGWKQIQYKCLVPSAIKDSTVFFYLYYYGHERAYFDDLTVRVYPMKY